MNREWLDLKYPGLTDRLGHESDQSIGNDYGLSRERVRQFRAHFGIESFEKQQRRLITEAAAPHLGKLPDGEIAAMFGVSASTVQKIRVRQGIPACSTEKYADQLSEIEHRLGIESDNAIARELGIPAQRVTSYRNKLGIAPIHPSPSTGFNKIDRGAIRSMFEQGKSDQEIADALGSTRGTIANIRTQELALHRRGPRGSRARKVDRDRVKFLAERGWTDKAIAEACACNAGHINRLRNKFGWR